ncbi:hypothetical protein [Actinomycetospora aeridis]|uniref:Uncharacterized protein n=1 Tax=Actinomycetospora aeridis TaxID=3129231 RepID=A0ABU8N691_9PSEU
MDCDTTDLDTGADAVDTDDGEDVSFESTDDSFSSDTSDTSDSLCGDDTTWEPDSSESSDDVVVSSEAAEDTSDADGGHCAPADSPSLSDPSVDEVAPSQPVSTPAAASTSAPLVALPDHVGVPGERLGSSPDSATIVTPGVFTPTSFDAAGNATHVSYSGVIEPSRTMETFGGNQTMPASTHPQVLATQALLNQTNADMITNTLTGVSVDRSGSSPVYYGAGKPFDDFGDALGNERDPR